jgi:DNA-binding PadR family transcriptional regulator
MSLDAAVPRDRNERTTKDGIVYILSQNWPLSARKIYSSLKKNNNGRDVSYQAVHKTLKSLVDAGILEREGRDYRISGEWIEETGKFISDLKDRYSKGKKPVLDSESQFVFHTIYDVDKFMVEMEERLVDKTSKEKPLVCLHWSHYWIPLFLEKQVYRKMKDMVKFVRYYCVVSGDTPVDRWCEEFWKKNNVNSVCGVGDTGVSDYMVLGDMVMQIFYPKDIMKEMDDIFSSARSIHDIKMENFFEQVFERKTTIPVTITGNPVLAEQLRNRILSHFKKK